MLGGLLSLLSAVTFAYANASARRGVLTGTVLQAVAISLPVGLPFFVLALWISNGFEKLVSFDGRSLTLLIVAGVIHFALARYCNYRATKAIGANLVAPIQQYSLVITLVLAVVWLGEALTVLRIIGIILVVGGPGFTMGPNKKPPASPASSANGAAAKAFAPAYREGYFFALLSALGFGLSPVLIGMAFETEGLAIGIAGGFISYVAATIAICLPLLLPGQWRSFRNIDSVTTKWFLVSGVAVGISQMTRYMALAVAPVSVVSPIQRLSLIFRIYFGALLNPHHEVFGSRVIAGTIISLVGAVALSVSINGMVEMLPLPEPLISLLAWSWTFSWH